MRILGKIVIGIVVVTVLLLGAAAVAVSTLGRQTLVPPIAARVKAMTGRELTVAGDARVALALPPRIVLQDIALSNAPWAGTAPMVEARELAVTVELLPLLSRRIELVRIDLVGPRMAFVKDAAGRGNWQFEERGAPAGAVAVPAPGLPAALAVGNVSVRDGVLTYRDAPSAAPATITIADFALHTRPVSGELDVRFAGASGALPIDVQGTVGPLRDLLARRWPYPVDMGGTIAGQKVSVVAKVRADGTRYALNDLALRVGENALRGTFAVDTGGARPRLAFDLAAPKLALAALPAAVAMPAIAPAPTPGEAAVRAAGARLLPTTPVSFAALGVVDAAGTLAVDELTLADGRKTGRLRARVALADRKLEVTELEAAFLGGTLHGSASIDARQPANAVIVTRLEGRALSLGALFDAIGRPRDVSGGRADLVANLTLRGDSPAAWAGSATGTLRLVSGPATLVNPRAQAILVWDRLNEAINPFRTRDASTELVCAVVNLPLANGVARVDRSLAMETSKLGVSASGVLDFRNETLDLVFTPKVRQGISIDFAGFAHLVRLTGPFAAPQIAVDVAGSAKVVASVGAAIGTGGISAVAQTLFSWAEGKGPGPCQIALEGAAAAPATPAAAAGAPVAEAVTPLVEGVGKAIGKLFGK